MSNSNTFLSTLTDAGINVNNGTTAAVESVNELESSTVRSLFKSLSGNTATGANAILALNVKYLIVNGLESGASSVPLSDEQVDAAKESTKTLLENVATEHERTFRARSGSEGVGRPVDPNRPRQQAVSVFQRGIAADGTLPTQAAFVNDMKAQFPGHTEGTLGQYFYHARRKLGITGHQRNKNG